MSIDRVEEMAFSTSVIVSHYTDLIMLKLHCVLKNIARRTVVLSATKVRNYTVHETGEHGRDRSVDWASQLCQLLFSGFSFQTAIPRCSLNVMQQSELQSKSMRPLLQSTEFSQNTSCWILWSMRLKVPQIKCFTGVKTSTLISKTAQYEVTVKKPEKLQESSKRVLRTRQVFLLL